MAENILPASFADFPVHLVGIKGTGMAALAEFLASRGARLSGSDTHDKFYTDAILASLGIPFKEGFHPANLPGDVKLVVYSAAYDPSAHPELLEAARLGIPMMTYTEALGAVSGRSNSSGISGVHGKTTTTALAGTLAKACGLPASIIAGSAVSNFGGRSTLLLGSRYFIAETCEYRRHFLSFYPKRIICTSIEPDHLDYFSGYEDILDAFVTYGERLPHGGEFIYCADDPGASQAACILSEKRHDIRLVPYGEKARGRFTVNDIRTGQGRTLFRLEGFSGDFAVRIPGRHTVLNAVAACALIMSLIEAERGSVGTQELEKIKAGLLDFAGSKRRSEIIGEKRGILFMDDYAHHPTAIRTTLEGLRAFYPGRRIIADFMAHTYSRTKVLMDDFAASFGAADVVILHKIYPSARETETLGITGRDLYEKVILCHENVLYFEEVMDAYPWARSTLKAQDLFVTFGAGDNFTLSWKLYNEIEA